MTQALFPKKPLSLSEVLLRLQTVVETIGHTSKHNPFVGSISITCPPEGGFAALIDTQNVPKSFAELANKDHSYCKTEGEGQPPAKKPKLCSAFGCSVCHESLDELLESETRLVNGRCGHLLCEACADKLKKSFKNRCPMCRSSLGTLRPVFV